MIKVLSLDLQGTLSDARFSDYFWLEFLPKKYSDKFDVSLEEAKKVLKQEFKEYGVDDIRYYDDKYWSNYLGFDTSLELDLFSVRPKINDELYRLILSFALPKIIISTTTDLFIKYELQERIKDFDKVYSCVDYFNVGGKSVDVFKKVCDDLGVKPNEVLHIGDNKMMDVDNAVKAGLNAILYDGDVEKLKCELKKYI